MRLVAKAIALSIFISFLAVRLAAADTQQGITISPVQKEIIISSGLVEATTNVELTNRTGKNLVGTIRLVDFKTLNETSGLLFSQAGVPTDRYGLANWMTLPNGEVINVLDGQTSTIPVHISNRADLSPGGHYGAVVVTLGTAKQAGNTQASFKEELVSLLLVNKRGGEEYGLQLQSFSTNTNTAIPSTANLKFRATGNVHVVPRGYIEVADPKGKMVAKGIINTQSTVLLPGTSRQFVTALEPIGNSTVTGKYKVTAYYRYDDQKKFSSQSIYVMRLTRSLPLVILAVITGLVGLLFIHRLVRNKRKFANSPSSVSPRYK